MKHKEKPKRSIARQLRNMLLCVFAPLISMLIVSVAVSGAINLHFEEITLSVTEAAEFGNGFKDNMNSRAYAYVINPGAHNLPVAELRSAREITGRLFDATKDYTGRAKLNKINNLLGSLEADIYKLGELTTYDGRMGTLESGIYPTTGAIESTIYEYIYTETSYMAKMQSVYSVRINRLIVSMIVISVILIVCLMIYAMRCSRNITDPISSLCGDVKRIGGGDFSVRTADVQSLEISMLSDGIEMMERRILSLMERVKEEQASLYAKELQLLQAQINPHFLYNTLDTIVWLAEAKKTSEVVDMVKSLSTFFRTTLSKGCDIVTVRDVIEHVKSYLEIQQVRYSDVMSYSIDIDESLYGCAVPKLTLQPLVENALYHGIKNKRGGGHIGISGRIDGELLILTVSDTGAGMTPERLDELRASLDDVQSVGFGVKNVSERIKLYFGREYGLEFESVDGGGTTVDVVLPKQKYSTTIEK